MKNKYLKNLNKIEFVVTYACTGRCKHCSEGNHESVGDSINAGVAADAVRRIAAEYDIKTVMAFGGEPLLRIDTVYEIMRAATEMNVARRQVITNGFFSTDDEKICKVAIELAECGVNDLLLSVDAFHQETIPLDVVQRFAKEVGRGGIPIRLQPAWLRGAMDDNPYNRRTREILDSFGFLSIPESAGNVIFPEGNAQIYLSEYFGNESVENPYIEDPCDVKCLSFSPNGDLLNGNVYERNVMEIIESYKPC